MQQVKQSSQNKYGIAAPKKASTIKRSLTLASNFSHYQQEHLPWATYFYVRVNWMGIFCLNALNTFVQLKCPTKSVVDQNKPKSIVSGRYKLLLTIIFVYCTSKSCYFLAVRILSIQVLYRELSVHSTLYVLCLIFTTIPIKHPVNGVVVFWNIIR